MKWTLLDMTQDILNDMDADSVNSIFDTFESEQVAQIIKTTYFAMISNRFWAHLKKPVQISPYSNLDYPTHMRVQDEIYRLISINYNKAKEGETRKRYQSVRYVEPDHFLRISNQLNNDEENVDVIIDPTGVELLIQNDRAPTCYTTFDDETLVFNAYDKTVDDTLQESKTQAQAYVVPRWKVEDTFVPDLPMDSFIALLEKAKSRAMLKLKQMEDPSAEVEQGRQQRWLARNNWRVSGGIKYPNYGRRSRKMYREPTFKQENN